MSLGRARSEHTLLPTSGHFTRAWGLLILGLLLLTVTGCETLHARLARNQALLQTLPQEHQTLIRQGRIQVGFTPSEVYLAWGAPSRKAITENARGSSETWFYTATQSETFYQQERYFDWEFGVWRYFDRPISRYREYLYQKAIFTNGALVSFTLYPTPGASANDQLRP